jgi:hypothetical protein
MSFLPYDTYLKSVCSDRLKARSAEPAYSVKAGFPVGILHRQGEILYLMFIPYISIIYQNMHKEVM